MQRKHPTSASILNPKPGDVIHLHAYRRVSTRRQLRDGSPARQLQRIRHAVEELKTGFPEAHFVFHQDAECLAEPHDRPTARKSLRQLLEEVERPQHYLIVADGSPVEMDRWDITRVTREPEQLAVLMDRRCKIITASNPFCRRSDLLEEVELAIAEFRKNRRNRGSQMEVPAPKGRSSRQREASRTNGRANLLHAKKKWRRLLQWMRFSSVSCRSAAEVASDLHGWGFRTPTGAPLRPVHVHRMVERNWLKAPKRWRRRSRETECAALCGVL